MYHFFLESIYIYFFFFFFCWSAPWRQPSCYNYIIQDIYTKSISCSSPPLMTSQAQKISHAPDHPTSTVHRCHAPLMHRCHARPSLPVVPDPNPTPPNPYGNGLHHTAAIWLYVNVNTRTTIYHNL